MFLVKLALANLIIVSCVLLGKRFPSLAGLIATMPLTSLVVLVWLASDNGAAPGLYRNYVHGALWGILPTIAFFAAAYLCLRKGVGLPSALAVSGVVWLAGALLHQWYLR